VAVILSEVAANISFGLCFSGRAATQSKNLSFTPYGGMYSSRCDIRHACSSGRPGCSCRETRGFFLICGLWFALI
jgi:hypothetical protein